LTYANFDQEKVRILALCVQISLTFSPIISHFRLPNLVRNGKMMGATVAF